MTRIRPAGAADAPAIVALEVAGLGVDAWPPGLVEAGVTGGLPTVGYLVADVGGAVAAYAVASLVPDVAALQRIAVDPAHRRRGLATLLLEEVVGLAVTAGAGRLLLEVREDNAAGRAFYGARGFVGIGRRRRYYRDGADALVLELAVPRGVSRPGGGTMGR